MIRNVGESIRIAIRALGANKLRALLTMLGIIIGVSAVISLMSVGRGAQAAVTERIQGLGTNLSQLEATDWQGNAKRAVVEAVGRVTGAARARCDAAEGAITSFVRRQLEGVLAADR